MHLYHFLLLLSSFMYKRAQLVCAWGRNWVYTQGIVYSLGHFKAFIQHIFDCIVCRIFGAWTPYSVPRCVKPVLAYTTPSVCVCLGFLCLSAGLEALLADLPHLCTLAIWHPQRGSAFCVITLLVPKANRPKMSIRHKPFVCQHQKYGLTQAVFLDDQSLSLGVHFVRRINWSLFQPLWEIEGRNDSYWKWWPKNRFCCPL